MGSFSDILMCALPAPQATETLVVEQQARLRAETKEEDERRERISTTAQTAAIQQQHSKEMETERLTRTKLETEASMKAQVSGHRGVFFLSSPFFCFCRFLSFFVVFCRFLSFFIFPAIVFVCVCSVLSRPFHRF